MPSQEDYLDNLLKGMENENTEAEKTGTAETSGTSESVEGKEPQIDMSDMDDLLKSALDAQSTDSTVHPEETANMSEEEIDKLLQKSQEQPTDAPSQENADANDDLIKMLENADAEGLSGILDQVAPAADLGENEQSEKEMPQEDVGKHDKKKKKRGFFDRFKKKSKKEKEVTPDETEVQQPAGEEEVSEIPVDSENIEAIESADSEDNTSENTSSDGMDDLDALLAGAFSDQPESEDNASEEPESADVMDILKAAGADIVDGPEQKQKKKGFFSKLLDLFTEEDEEEEEADQLQLSDENKKILEEVDKGGKKKKGKKEKKPKKEKQPKPKKPAKEKKKKEKPEKEEKPAVPEKKLSPKKIIPIVVVCISLGAVILLVGNFLTDYMAKRSGREAYYAGDYQTCYQNLFGKELDETEQVMYGQSESILTIRMWMREYEVFVNEGSELEALDSLLQAVRDYPTLLNYAAEWNAQDEVSSAFQDILNVLSQKYQLSQEEAQQIADISDNVEYTKNVMLILQKLGLGSWDIPQGATLDVMPAQNTEDISEQLPDMLPEEKEMFLPDMLPEEREMLP